MESKIDLTRFFPVKCEVAKIMTRVELGFVDGSGFRASVRKLIYMPETIQTFFFFSLDNFSIIVKWSFACGALSHISVVS